MELIALFFLAPLGLGTALAIAVFALALIVGLVVLCALLFISLFEYIFSAMTFIGIILLAVIAYYSPPLLIFVFAIIAVIWLFPEPKGENRERGIPFVALFNFCVLPLLIMYFYQIAQFDGLISTLFALLSTLAFDLILTLKRPNLVERNMNFLWLY